jgi:hypothetical protein
VRPADRDHPQQFRSRARGHDAEPSPALGTMGCPGAERMVMMRGWRCVARTRVVPVIGALSRSLADRDLAGRCAQRPLVRCCP